MLLRWAYVCVAVGAEMASVALPLGHCHWGMPGQVALGPLSVASPRCWKDIGAGLGQVARPFHVAASGRAPTTAAPRSLQFPSTTLTNSGYDVRRRNCAVVAERRSTAYVLIASARGDQYSAEKEAILRAVVDSFRLR